MNNEETTVVMYPYTESTNTVVLGLRKIAIDGAVFEWWGVGDRPTLVIVRSTSLGSRTAFTDGKPRDVAQTLAEAMLADHYQRVAEWEDAGGSAAKVVPLVPRKKR